MTSKVELRKFSDGDLMLLVSLRQGSNFWIHDDGTCSWVPKKSEVELIKEGLYAIDTYNVLKSNLKSRSRS